MSRLGIGPYLLGVGAVVALIVIALEERFGFSLALPSPYHEGIYALGLLLILVGVYFWISGAVQVERAYREHRLVTTGTYRFCRNPMYTGFLLFIIPGIALAVNDLVLLIIPAAMCMAFKILIKKEEVYLAREFGPEFEKYSNSVSRLVPFLRP